MSDIFTIELYDDDVHHLIKILNGIANISDLVTIDHRNNVIVISAENTKHSKLKCRFTYEKSDNRNLKAKYDIRQFIETINKMHHNSQGITHRLTIKISNLCQLKITYLTFSDLIYCNYEYDIYPVNFEVL